MKWLKRLLEPSPADFEAVDQKCRAMARDRKELHELRQVAAEKLGQRNWRFDYDLPSNPKLDAVIADTVAKIKAVPTRGPFPAKRKRT